MTPLPLMGSFNRFIDASLPASPPPCPYFWELVPSRALISKITFQSSRIAVCRRMAASPFRPTSLSPEDSIFSAQKNVLKLRAGFSCPFWFPLCLLSLEKRSRFASRPFHCGPRISFVSPKLCLCLHLLLYDVFSE